MLTLLKTLEGKRVKMEIDGITGSVIGFLMSVDVGAAIIKIGSCPHNKITTIDGNHLVAFEEA
ncbi:MAG: hypothetical protein ACRCYE_11735 [Sarcina sp.]